MADGGLVLLPCFSALQRAEIAEIAFASLDLDADDAVSVLFNEPKLLKLDADLDLPVRVSKCFSALQRAEIAEIGCRTVPDGVLRAVSVLFNEPKLLKCQRDCYIIPVLRAFQCSSTSRNC